MNKIQIIRLIIFSQFFFSLAQTATAASVLYYQNPINQQVIKELEDITLTISDKNLVISTVSKNTQSSTVTLMSIVGQNMGEWKLDWDASGKQIKKINITNIPSGIYIFTIRTGDRNMSRKVII